MNHIIKKPDIVYMDGDLTLFHNPKLKSTISALMDELHTDEADKVTIVNHLLVTRYNNSFEAMAKDIARLSKVELEDIISQKRLSELEKMHEDEVTGFQLYPDTKQFIQELRSLNIKTALASNVTEFYRNISRKMFSMDKILDRIYLSCELGYAKLDKSFYEKILKLDNINPTNAIMIGDNEKADVLAAKEAGLDALLITREKDGSQERDTFSSHLKTNTAQSVNANYKTVTNLEEALKIIKDRK